MRKTFALLYRKSNSGIVFLSRYFTAFGNLFISIKKINIGGGANFFGLGWVNLDALKVHGTKFFLFEPDSVMPFGDNKIDLVYSSHCFEHLDDATINQLLVESFRVLKKGGKLLIKVPDFDGINQEYKKNNFEYIKNLGQDSVFWTWPNFNITINIENCYAMVITGYWNHAYGDHFSKQINIDNAKAYHGPPHMDLAALKNILNTDDVRVVSKKLNQIAVADPDFKQFNHQNAWSREQFTNLIVKFGFELIRLDRSDVLNNYKYIPNIYSMSDWSMFILAEK